MENPSFHLEGIIKEKDELQDFEGPLSLILMLLSKDKIEIRDLSISDILDQYLEYLEKMQSMDLEIASEFVQMASHLLYIKTRTLLAGDGEVSELEMLMESLERLKAKDVFTSVSEVIPAMKKASELGLLYYARMPEPLPTEGKEYRYSHEPAELLKAMYSIYSRGGRTPDRESLSEAVPKRIVYSIRDKSAHILSLLRKGPVSISRLYSECRSRSEVVAVFMSVLELCSLGSLHISAGSGGYTVEFVGGDMDEILEKIAE